MPEIAILSGLNRNTNEERITTWNKERIPKITVKASI